MRYAPRFVFALTVGAASLCLSSCTLFENEAAQQYSENHDAAAEESRIYTTADVRLVIERRHPLTRQMVSCTEPTPDVAKALSTALSLTLKGGTPNASGQIGGGATSAEAMAELAGRSTALLALRDGLFRACEAYLNGAIGVDAYALILTRYGQLMTTLFLGEDIRGAVATSAITASTASSSAPAPINTDNTSDNSTNGGSSAPAAKKKTGSQAGKTSFLMQAVPRFIQVINQTLDAGTAPAAGATASAPGAAQGSGPQPAPSSGPAAVTKPQKPKPADSSGPNAKVDTANVQSNSTTPSATAVGVLGEVRLGEDYYDQDVNPVHQLLAACVNEYDPTRVRVPVSLPTSNAALATATQPELNSLKKQIGALDEGQRRLQAQLDSQSTTLSAIQSSLERLHTPASRAADQSSASANATTQISESAQRTQFALTTINTLSGPVDDIGPNLAGQNAFLRRTCPGFANIKTLLAAETLLLPVLTAAGHPGPVVQPDAVLSGGKTPNSPITAEPQNQNPGGSGNKPSKPDSSRKSSAHGHNVPPSSSAPEPGTSPT
jgi:hypothetical protein